MDTTHCSADDTRYTSRRFILSDETQITNLQGVGGLATVRIGSIYQTCAQQRRLLMLPVLCVPHQCVLLKHETLINNIIQNPPSQGTQISYE